MFDKEKINILGQEFKDKAYHLESLFEYTEQVNGKFLKVKLAFTALIGVLFVIVIDKLENFGKSFLIIFITIVISTFVLLIYDLWRSMKDAEEANKKQYRRTMLAKIRHIAAMEEDRPNMPIYGSRAEELLIREEDTRQAMFNGESVNEIIKYPGGGNWQLHFILWTIIFISVPILFLLGIFNVL